MVGIPDALLGAVVCALVFTAMWGDLALEGGRDWDQSQANLISAARSIFEEKEPPFWMPHRLGGHDAFADPQSDWLSPHGFLVLAFGFPVGARLFIALAAGFGALGAAALGNGLGLGFLGRGMLALVLFLSSSVALYTAGGLPQFVLGAAILPWLMALLNRAGRKAAVAGGLLLAVDLYGGDINHFIFHALFVALLGCATAALRRSVAPLGWVAVMGISAFVLSAPKFVPTSLFALDNPRTIDVVSHEPGLTPRLILRALTDPGAGAHLKRHHGELMVATSAAELVSLAYATPEQAARAELFVVWINAGAYVGGGVLLLAACGGLGMAVRPRPTGAAILHPSAGTGRAHGLPAFLAALFLPTAVFFWLCLGITVTPSAWAALHTLPVFSSLRSPPRLIYYTLPMIGLMAGLGLEQARALAARRMGDTWAKVLGAAVLVLIMADVHLASRDLFGLALCEPPLKVAARSGFRQVTGEVEQGRTWYGPPTTPFARAGLGVVNGYYGGIPPSRAVVPEGHGDYRGEVFFADGTRGRVQNHTFTARRVEIDCETEAGGLLVVNQNWAPGWRAVFPPEAAAGRHADGRIGITVPPGTGRVLLRYTPPGLWWGCGLFLIGAPALLIWAARGPAGPVRHDLRLCLR